MIHLATRDDQDDVVRIFAHPAVFPHIQAGCAVHELPDRVEATWTRFSYWLTEERDALFQVEPMDGEPYVMVHAAAYPEARGRRMLAAWRQLLFALDGAGVMVAYSWIPKTNTRAWCFALLCGGTPCGEPGENPDPDYYDQRGLWQYIEVKERLWAVR